MAYTGNLTARHKLHRQLIDVENTPCSNPDCQTPYYNREVHRIIAGGEYTEANVLVRCFNCHHFIDHPNSKFRTGDRIILNGRTPQFIDLPRHRPRTIIAIRYDKDKQCNFYLLGSNNRGVNSGNGNTLEGYTDYWFRSYQMLPYQPRYYHFHRKYNRRQIDSISSDKQECHETGSVNMIGFTKAKIAP